MLVILIIAAFISGILQGMQDIHRFPFFDVNTSQYQNFKISTQHIAEWGIENENPRALAFVVKALRNKDTSMVVNNENACDMLRYSIIKEKPQAVALLVDLNLPVNQGHKDLATLKLHEAKMAKLGCESNLYDSFAYLQDGIDIPYQWQNYNTSVSAMKKICKLLQNK